MSRDTDATTFGLDVSSATTLSGESSKIEFDDEKNNGPEGWSFLLVLAGVTCCLGSALPAGFNIGVMNNAAHVGVLSFPALSSVLSTLSTTSSNPIRAFCNQSVQRRYGVQLSAEALNVLWSAVVSIFLIGGVTGSLIAGWLADKFGRRSALVVGNVCGILGAILFLIVPGTFSVEILLAGRLVVGLSGGLATSLVPTYMTEVAPLGLRGAAGVSCQLGITCGVLLGQIMGLQTVLGTEASWHVMLASFSPLCLLALVSTVFLPESPKYLYVVRNLRAKALQELARLRNVEAMLLEREVADLQREATTDAASADAWTIGKVLGDPSLRLPLLLVCSMQFGQQLSGINAVFYYSSSIFANAGLDTKGAQYATLGTGVVNVATALAAVPLMSLFGRRTLFLKSCYLSIGYLLVLWITVTFIGAASFMPWICISAVLAYVLAYGLGLGPIPYFIGSEIFDAGPRPTAMALGSVSNWGGNFLVGMTFPSLQAMIGPYIFLVFAVTTSFLALFCRFYLPETRGRATTDITVTMTQGFESRPNYERVVRRNDVVYPFVRE